MTNFEPYYRKFESLPQRHQLTTTLHSTIEEVFEIIDIDDVCMSKFDSMTYPIFSKNFDNTFRHQNGPNQHQHAHKIQVNGINIYRIKD